QSSELLRQHTTSRHQNRRGLTAPPSRCRPTCAASSYSLSRSARVRRAALLVLSSVLLSGFDYVSLFDQKQRHLGRDAALLDQFAHLLAGGGRVNRANSVDPDAAERVVAGQFLGHTEALPR